MKNKITMITLVLLVAVTGRLAAQIDPHFSQYYANPLWLNPALTGVINGDTRLSSNYKNQWGDINNAYQTVAIAVDHRSTDKLSIGFNMLDQSAGGHSYNYLSAYGSLGYGIIVSNDENRRINFGLQAGFINRSFDMSKLQFGDQYSPITGFDPTATSFESFPSTNSTVFDASAGVFYYDGSPLSTVNAFGGFSVSHLSRPKDAFSPDGKGKIPIRYDVHGGLRFHVTDVFDLVPNALYIKQQNTDIKAVGVYSEFKMQNDNAFILGVLQRFGDATSIDVGYHVNSLIIGTSYDINTSSLNRASNGRGGIELSLSYVFHKRIQEPEPICPRL